MFIKGKSFASGGADVRDPDSPSSNCSPAFSELHCRVLVLDAGFYYRMWGASEPPLWLKSLSSASLALAEIEVADGRSQGAPEGSDSAFRCTY